MQLFCPACEAAFAGVSRCPRCAGLLLMPQEAVPPPPRARMDGHDPLPSAPGLRVFVGILLALGAYLGLRKVATGFVMATQADPEAWWLSFDGLVVVFGLQTLATLFGALLAGSGRPRGFGLGAVVGGACGGLFLATELWGGAPPRHLVFYLQMPVLLLAGGVAGVFGARIWSAAPELDMPIPTPPPASKLSSAMLVGDAPKEEDRPTAWVRVLIGAAVIIAGFALADRGRFLAQKYSDGILKVDSRGQGRYLSWQFATLAGLIGAAVAGAGTGAGLRHGLYAGVLGGLGVLGMAAVEGQPAPALGYWLSRMNMATLPPQDPAVMATAFGGVLLTGLLGGWLGGTLFLPLAPPHLRGRRLRDI